MAAAVTEGQRLRGHGERGWAEAGWDLKKRTLSEKLQKLVLTYGELAQATYDNVGTDRSQPATFGYCLMEQQPNRLLAYLTDKYPLAPGANGPEPKLWGTAKTYELPPVCVEDSLSPIFYARPGKSSANNPPVACGKLGVLEAAADKVFATVAGAAATLVDGSNGGRRLFVPDPDTGRGVVERGAFIGYIAVSTTKVLGGEVDVAIVWRGTIFKEEWESNFASDKLTEWVSDPKAKANSLKPGGGGDDYKAPSPTEVGVHDGFDDIYNRRTDQPGYTQRAQKTQGSKAGQLSPREALRMWLPRLFEKYNVTTVTCTGHSLGGGLATLAAFGAADLLESSWDGAWAAERKKGDGWKTEAKPKVSLFSFASPRVGNYTFGQTMRKRVAVMRVVNKGDVVPLVPGIVVQGLSWLVEAVPRAGKRAAIDSNSWLVQGCQALYYWVSRATSLLYPDKYGYFHVGQVLLLDTGDATGTVRPGAGKHNLELHLHLVSRLGQRPGMPRNPLLMNKHGDQWTNDDAPADWWHAPLRRHCTQLPDGRWTHLRAYPATAPVGVPAPATAPAEVAAPAAAPAGVAAADDG
ncbi:hypothetical protein OEZ86_008251 [Tetradesmus obliquus]|nr:hypothetical protein OEZ86_008251 [Tetradesmus obliquus]